MTEDVKEIAQAFKDVADELMLARAAHPGGYRSAHEGKAVIEEELDELWDEIKVKRPNMQRMREEAIQVASTAIRFLIDVCPTSVCKEPVEIYVNGRKISLLPKTVLFDDVRRLAGYDEADTVTFRVGEHRAGVLHPKEGIFLEQGMVFNVAFTDAA